MTFAAASQHATPESDLDRQVRTVKDKADEFAHLPTGEKARLLGELLPAVRAVAADWVTAGCRMKGIEASGPESAEEWLSGPTITLRVFRRLHQTLEAIAQTGKPPIPKLRTRPDGRVEAQVFPAEAVDTALFAGFTARCLMEKGLDERAVLARQASYYKVPEKARKPSVAVILGAGNVSSIPPTDTIYKMFAEGRVAILKLNPVNEYVGPFLEKALKSLIDRGYLQIAYGGGDAGKHLVDHPDVDDVHITGSDKTHDLIVWGPAGPERERRKRDNDPLLKKSITSELGNVSPVVIVPGPYSDNQLWFMARNVASMVANNASFNCNAAKVLVLSAGWAQGDLFRDLLRRALAALPVRKAYYPGALDRYRELTSGHQVEKFGDVKEGTLQWAYVRGLDPTNTDEKLYFTEPFCAILSEVALPESDPAGYLAAATRFCNDRLWGTLNAAILIHPQTEVEPQAAAALEQALIDLRYGTVSINHWPAVGYGFGSTPWGGHPSATLADIQSGIGWVHNGYLLEGIEKCIVRGPLLVRPHPVWFYDNKMAHEVARRMVDFEASPSWVKLPAIALTALRG